MTLYYPVPELFRTGTGPKEQYAIKCGIYPEEYSSTLWLNVIQSNTPKKHSTIIALVQSQFTCLLVFLELYICSSQIESRLAKKVSNGNIVIFCGLSHCIMVKEVKQTKNRL